MRPFPSRRSWLATTMAAAAAIVACGDRPNVEVGAPLPAFELTTLDGGRFGSSDLEGRPAVIAFWATWCRPCLKDIPALHELLDDGGIEVVSITLDQDLDAVRSFVEEESLRYRVLLGDQDVFTRMRGFSIPYTLVVDGEGTLQATFRGPFEADDVREAVSVPAG